jgi:hypothetical protein
MADDIKPRRIQAPAFWGSFEEVLRFRDRLLAELEAGRMSVSQFRRRVKTICKKYSAEVQRQVQAG